MRSRNICFASAAACAAVLHPAAASAQEIGSTASGVFGNDREYQPIPLRVGPFTIEVGTEARADYTSNIYATPDNEQGDIIARIRPYAKVTHTAGQLTTTLSSRLDVRRHADFSSEDSEAADVQLTTRWSPEPGQSLFLTGQVSRVIEDRGDPESRQIQVIGPRPYRILGGTAGYSRRGSRFMFEVEGDIRNIDALDPIDDDRDYETYSGRVTVGYRPGGPFYITGTGYYNRRNFRLLETGTNIDRDVSTYGGLLGISFADGGLFEGRVGAGIFKLTADDPLRNGRTGFSLQGQLAYRPSQRTAIKLNVFSGDVTSFRSGASTRIETRAGLAIEKEIRHNLLGSAGVEWQRYKFSGAVPQIRQERWRASGELELLINRQMSAFGRASYSTRSSDDPLDEYSRFQAGAGVRFRF
ncbi:MAG: outer membrane beta-barrel protein [Erythrobacter sp.]